MGLEHIKALNSYFNIWNRRNGKSDRVTASWNNNIALGDWFLNEADINTLFAFILRCLRLCNKLEFNSKNSFMDIYYIRVWPTLFFCILFQAMIKFYECLLICINYSLIRYSPLEVFSKPNFVILEWSKYWTQGYLDIPVLNHIKFTSLF